MKAVGLLSAVEGDGVLQHARRAEIVDTAADGKYQDVVSDFARRDDFFAMLVEHGAHEHLPIGAIKPHHFTE